MSKLVASETIPPVGALMTSSALTFKTLVTVSWGKETSLTSQGAVSSTTNSQVNFILFYLSKVIKFSQVSVQCLSSAELRQLPGDRPAARHLPGQGLIVDERL